MYLEEEKNRDTIKRYLRIAQRKHSVMHCIVCIRCIIETLIVVARLNDIPATVMLVFILTLYFSVRSVKLYTYITFDSVRVIN